MKSLIQLVGAILVIFLLLLIYLAIFPPRVTPEGYFNISKEERLKLIEKLRSDCTSEDVIYLIATYSDVLHDKNASHCWGQYMKNCYKAKENNQSLKLPITCPSY